MRWLLLILALLATVSWFWPSVMAAEPVAKFSRFCASCRIWGADSFLSQSGQFVVHGNSIPQTFAPRSMSTNSAAMVELEPQLVAVTAERTKRAFLSVLKAEDRFQAKIHIVVVDRPSPEQPVGIISSLYSDGYQYRVVASRWMEHTTFVKALVKVLLLEYSQRGTKRAVELPTWLIEGMTRQVLSSPVPTYVVNEKPITLEFEGIDRLRATRAYLQTNTPLTIQELSFGEPSKGTDQERERYESCAHLLVHQLLRLKDGPVLLNRFIRTLPHRLNWQTAFYAAYRPQISSALDLEKWWALTWIHFNRQDQESWPLDYSMQRLDAILMTAMEIRTDTQSLPQHKDATLREVIEKGTWNAQQQVFSDKLQKLSFLRMNLSAEAAAIAREYQQVLDRYLSRRGLIRYQPGLKRSPEMRLQELLQTTFKELEALDRTRARITGQLEGGVASNQAR